VFVNLWLQKLLEESRLFEIGNFSLYCDNMAAISMTHNPVHHDQAKHVEID